MKSLLLSAMVFSLFLCSQTRASEWDKDTRVTFTGAIQVPGTVLDAGTYRFRLADNISNRNIVQIFNGDGTRLIETVFAVPNWQLQPSGETVLLYAERRSGQPPAVEAWFYPGDNFGQQFVYPKSQAAELSQLNHTNVPSSEAEESGSTPPSNVEPAQPAATPEASVETQAPSAQPEANEFAEVQPTPEPQAQSNSTPSTLPQTASQVPLMGLAGLFFLGAASLLGVVIRHRA